GVSVQDGEEQPQSGEEPCFIPGSIYASQDDELTLSTDNIIVSDDAGEYSLKLASSQQPFGDSVTLPDEGGETSIIVSGEHGETTHDVNVVRVAVRESGESGRINVLIMGDSFVGMGAMPCEVKRLVSDVYGFTNVEFVGTRTARSGEDSVMSEGRGGYGFADFLKTDDSQGRGETVPNPYRTQDEVSLKAYFDENGVETPDVMVIYMGVNDLTQYGVGEEDAAEVIAARAGQWLELIGGEYPEARILLCGLVYISDDNGLRDASEFNAQIMRINRAYQSLAESGPLSERLTYVDTASTFDRNANYDVETIVHEDGATETRQTDWIHPSEEGFRKLAQPIAAALAATLGHISDTPS
ncbi:MAG: GDSL-type esterase/lipase family protein, partial [Clostridia bacterium]|nr:GDSL-type esterase/lipase family protein [Clostridia bacterium]